MDQVRLGGTGLRVSRICLGMMSYGLDRARAWQLGEDDAEPIVRQAVEAGVTFFDTADVYALGSGERVTGRLLGRLFPRRDDYVLATKVYFPMGEGPNDRGLSRKHIMEQSHRSLKRLGVDYVDLYQCHRPDPDTPLVETLRALEDLVRQGKALYVGVSEWSAELLDEARRIQRERGWDPLVSSQPQYSMLYRPIEADIIPLSEQLGMGQVVFSPIAQGVLTGKYRPGDEPPQGSRATGPDASFIQPFMRDDVLAAVQQLRPIADGLGVTMAQLAIAWVLRQENVSSAIVGASRPEQVDENLAASGVELGPDVLRAIDDALGSMVIR